MTIEMFTLRGLMRTRLKGRIENCLRQVPTDV
jgi:hypothetical protein